MWLMLQQDQSDDYVVATGQTHTVRNFLELAFGIAGMDYQDFVEVDPRYFRPTEVDILQGDSTKARKKLGWEPKVSLEGLARMMVEHDMELASQEKVLRDAGHEVPAQVEHEQ